MGIYRIIFLYPPLLSSEICLIFPVPFISNVPLFVIEPIIVHESVIDIDLSFSNVASYSI